jgi:hypothetical protein
MNRHGILTLLLCVLFVVFLGACAQVDTPSPAGAQTSSGTDTQTPSVQSAVPGNTSAESSAAPAPASADETSPTGAATGNEVWHSADGNWYVVLPDSWAGLYGIDERDGFVTFYDKANADAGYGGTLFTIGIYSEDETYDYLPDYQLITEHDGLSYVALFPTDVQCNYEDPTLMDLHSSMIDGMQDWVPTCIHFAN